MSRPFEKLVGRMTKPELRHQLKEATDRIAEAKRRIKVDRQLIRAIERKTGKR